VVAWLSPAAVEWKVCGCTAIAIATAGTVGGCPRIVEVSVAVPRVACRPCATSGGHLELPPEDPSMVHFLFFSSAVSQALIVPS
jgi:hypothetical protein